MCVCVCFPGERPEAFIRFSKRSVVPKGLRNTDNLSTEAENCSREAWLESSQREKYDPRKSHENFDGQEYVKPTQSGKECQFAFHADSFEKIERATGL